MNQIPRLHSISSSKFDRSLQYVREIGSHRVWVKKNVFSSIGSSALFSLDTGTRGIEKRIVLLDFYGEGLTHKLEYIVQKRIIVILDKES